MKKAYNTNPEEYEEFCKKIEENISKYLSEEYKDATVSVVDVIKNNDTKLKGLTIRKDSPKCIAPTLYLENIFEEYSKDLDFEDVLRHIAQVYMEADKNGLQDDAEDLIQHIMDFKAVKNKIYPRLINTEMNIERLKELPHKEISDFSVIYHIDLGGKYDGEMTVTINNTMLESYEDITIEQLHSIALKNMLRDNPPNIKPIEAILDELLSHKTDMDEEERSKVRMELNISETGMSVATNRNKIFGATVLLDTDFLEKIYERIGDYYILPSSIHEVIILQKNPGLEVSNLEAMVKEVNTTQVEANEILSDYVYTYNHDKKEVVRAIPEQGCTPTMLSEEVGCGA